jgi:hypothetical protein
MYEYSKFGMPTAVIRMQMSAKYTEYQETAKTLMVPAILPNPLVLDDAFAEMTPKLDEAPKPPVGARMQDSMMDSDSDGELVPLKKSEKDKKKEKKKDKKKGAPPAKGGSPKKPPAKRARRGAKVQAEARIEELASGDDDDDDDFEDVPRADQVMSALPPILPCTCRLDDHLTLRSYPTPHRALWLARARR